MCRCVWSRNLVNEEALAHWGLLCPPPQISDYIYSCFVKSVTEYQMDQCHVWVRTNRTGTINIIIIVITNLSDKINVLDCVWNMMAHAQKLDFVFRRNGRVHLNRRGRQFSRLLAAEVCVSAVVMLDTPCSEVVWRVLATHSIRQFPLHFTSHASTCAITFQLDSTISPQGHTRRPLWSL
jgi:hypothetical protein